MNLRSKISKSPLKYTVPQLTAELLEAVTITHKFHLEAKSRSYAEHVALGAFYNSIGESADDIYEQYAGQISPEPIPDSILTATEPIEYLEKLLNFVEETRLETPYSHLQNLMDEVKSLITGTLYKLKYLK